MTVIALKGLRKVFQVHRKPESSWARLVATFRPEMVAVKGIDLTVERGESLAFIGPNGAGKSTTIKMLTGILHPTAGRHVQPAGPHLRARLAGVPEAAGRVGGALRAAGDHAGPGSQALPRAADAVNRITLTPWSKVVELVRVFDWARLLWLAGAAAGFLGLGAWAFHLGLRRYESGNLMIMRS